MTEKLGKEGGGERKPPDLKKSAAELKISLAMPVAVSPPRADNQQIAIASSQPARLDPSLFPDRPRPGKGAPTTIANVRYLMEQHGITARYNVIKKRSEILVPGIVMTPENSDNVAREHIFSLASYNEMNIGSVGGFIEAVADANAYNPVADWINSVCWDGVDRLPDFYATLRAREGFPEGLKQTLMRKWLLSAAAAALSPSGFKCRGVLTLQGSQGLGKTSWGRRLISDPPLRDAVIKTDHHLDSGNKDSLVTAITHFIVEIGEVESSFRRDVSRLKGFLTAESDKIRRPYARSDSEYPRRTVFYATVNQADFLIDNTGNSRWWTIPVEWIDYNHNIDMQQLFAQLAVDFHNHEAWWLTAEEEAELAFRNSKHQAISVVRDAILEHIDLGREPSPQDHVFTATEMLQHAGFKYPTNPQAKECGAILRELFGDPKRINGRDKWRVPLNDSDFDDEPATKPPEYKKKFD
ncbi:MAG: virulence-associated E family protein [Sphingopyxis sp.]|nr:virulence-associated E family protein [Sphingopyxis sp.]